MTDLTPITPVLLAASMPLAPPAECKRLIEARSIPEPNSGCWLWEKACSEAGYGMINGRSHGAPSNRANRVSYLAFKGPIPAGLHVLHKCDNPYCVNPDHLFLGTQAANMADMVRKARSARGDRSGARVRPEQLPRGEQNGSAKLTAEQAAEIRAAPRQPGTGAALAKKFGISQMAVSDIRRGVTWKHLREAA